MRLAPCLRAAVWLLAGLAAVSGATSAAAQDGPEMPPASFAHTQAVRMARRGQYDEALNLLRLLCEANPDDARMRGDLVAVLGWAERDAEAVAAADELDLGDAPDYVVEAVARSLRNLGRYGEAAELFHAAAARFPEDSGLRLQEALARAEAGDLQAALPPLVELLDERPEDLDVLLAAALVRRWRGEYLASIELCDRALDLAPENDTAYRMRVLSTSDLGAASKAYADAQRRPDLFDEADLERMRMDRATSMVRWGRLPAPRPELQDAETELGLGLVDEVLLSTSSPALEERARFDRIVALQNARRPADAVRELEAYLRAHEGSDPLDVPAWVLVPVADAYLALGRGKEAIPLYEHSRALLRTRSAERFDATLGLFQAQLAADDFDAAARTLEELRAEEPAWRWTPDGKEARTNPRRLAADVAGLARFTWADRLGEAQRALVDAVERAPANAALRRELAALYLARGWPERALDEARTALGLEPGHPAGEALVARAQMDLREWSDARGTIEGLGARDDVDRALVRELRRTYDLKRAWEVRGEVFYGENDASGFFGGENAHAELTILSEPIDDHVRAFGHLYDSWGSFPEGDANLLRAGVGVQCEDRYWTARGELFLDLTRELDEGGDRDTRKLGGVGLSLEGRPDDRWTFAGRYESISLETPLRARQQGVEAELFGLSAAHRFSDDASLRGGVAALDFSDGNDREYAYLSGRKRVVTRPRYRLTVQPELYASRNSRGGETVYYNPRSDLEADLVLVNEWVAVRRPDHSWTHRAFVTLGSYTQEGFGAELVAGLAYEAEVTQKDDFGATFGVAWLSHPYDGNREGRWWVYFRPVVKL